MVTGRPTVVAADPEQWSEKSKHSYAYHYTREYSDIHYTCWTCRAGSTFTAQDQKYTFEVKKASIDQQRILCAVCWSETHQIRTAITDCDVRWLESKAKLQNDVQFLQQWLGLLFRLEAFVPYKPDIAKKNMLQKLLRLSDRSNADSRGAP